MDLTPGETRQTKSVAFGSEGSTPPIGDLGLIHMGSALKRAPYRFVFVCECSIPVVPTQGLRSEVRQDATGFGMPVVPFWGVVSITWANGDEFLLVMFRVCGGEI